MDQYWAQPPVTRTFAAFVFLESLAATLQLISPHKLIYHHSFLFTSLPEIWRIFTTFGLSSGFGVILMPYMIWQYGLPLERNSPRFTSASFFIYLLFVGVCLIVLAGELLQAPVLLGAMVLAISYTFAQENRGAQTNFVMVPMDVKFLPWAMLLFALIQGGPQHVLIEAMGIPAAHLYDFLTVHWPRYGGGLNLLSTPPILERWFANLQGAKRVDVKEHGTSFSPRHPPNVSVAASSGVSNPLSFRGTGRRLGGE